MALGGSIDGKAHGSGHLPCKPEFHYCTGCGSSLAAQAGASLSTFYMTACKFFLLFNFFPTIQRGSFIFNVMSVYEAYENNSFTNGIDSLSHHGGH